MEGMEATLRAIRRGGSGIGVVEMPPSQGTKGDGCAGGSLAGEYVSRTARVWQRLYPVQWAQTARTLRKLLKFDPHNTGAKLAGNARALFHKVTVLQYPELFCGELDTRANKRA